MYKFQEQDTLWLQLESIIKYASQLGYEFNGRSFYTTRFIPTGKIYKGKEDKVKKTYFISFDDMQRIHNEDRFHQDKYSRIGVVGGLKMACFSLGNKYKIVRFAKVQYNKKLKCFQCQNNWVEFV